MSSDQHPEEMRPIPDGGLKEAMPSWLKRPPAWRNMPSAEERHQRTLPEPDSSEIDPKSLVDVDDLPHWLQAIAAREKVELPQPDESVGHAVEQVQAAASRPVQDRIVTESEAPINEPENEELPTSMSKPTNQQEVGLLSDEPATTLPYTPGASRPPYLIWSLVICGLIIAALSVIIFTMM